MMTDPDAAQTDDAVIFDAHDPDDPGHTPTSLMETVSDLLAGAGTVRVTGRATGPFRAFSESGTYLGAFTTIVDTDEHGCQSSSDARRGRARHRIGVRWLGPLDSAPDVQPGGLVEVVGTWRVDGTTLMLATDALETDF